MIYDYGNINVTLKVLRCAQLTAVPTASGVQEESTYCREEYDDLPSQNLLR
jgi:hypothetical protein